MSRIETISVQHVDFIPKTPASGVLYVSTKYATATHLCCCGCGSKIVTPLKPGGWRYSEALGKPTLLPSIGSWNLPCQSHYFIRNGAIAWARQWTKEQIEDGRDRDRRERERHYDSKPDSGDQHNGPQDWIKKWLG